MRIFISDAHYHIICRGNNKEEVFSHKWDYLRYINLLKKYSNKHQAKILAYALMPNHIHLLVKQESKVPISKFMQSLNTAYVMYFNLKRHHIGHLFQGKFRYILVDTDDYLIHLSRYIHLNPSSSGVVTKPEDYQWSSYKRYLGIEPDDFLDKKPILGYFSRKDPIGDYREFVESRIDYQKEISLQKLFLE